MASSAIPKLTIAYDEARRETVGWYEKKAHRRSAALMSAGGVSKIEGCYATFWTFPERMQDVQTRSRLLAPLTSACTFCKFKFQRRLLTLWA